MYICDMNDKSKRVYHRFNNLELIDLHNTKGDIVKKVVENYNTKLAKLIVESLEKRGYSFQNTQQLYEFMKRCDLTISDKRSTASEIWYQNELLCTWD